MFLTTAGKSYIKCRHISYQVASYEQVLDRVGNGPFSNLPGIIEHLHRRVGVGEDPDSIFGRYLARQIEVTLRIYQKD